MFLTSGNVCLYHALLYVEVFLRLYKNIYKIVNDKNITMVHLYTEMSVPSQFLIVSWQETIIISPVIICGESALFINRIWKIG